MADNNILLIKKGTFSNFNKITTKDPNTIYFVYEEENGKMKPGSGRIYIGDVEFGRATECINDLSFITASGSSVAAIDKQD